MGIAQQRSQGVRAVTEAVECTCQRGPYGFTLNWRLRWTARACYPPLPLAPPHERKHRRLAHAQRRRHVAGHDEPDRAAQRHQRIGQPDGRPLAPHDGRVRRDQRVAPLRTSSRNGLGRLGRVSVGDLHERDRRARVAGQPSVSHVDGGRDQRLGRKPARPDAPQVQPRLLHVRRRRRQRAADSRALASSPRRTTRNTATKAPRGAANSAC